MNVSIRTPLTVHGLAAAGAIVLVIAASRGTFTPAPRSPFAQVTGGETMKMGVEHALPCSLSLAVSASTKGGIADVSHDAKETIYLSVPSSWMRREVKGASLSAVKSESPTFGFTRWTLPAGAAISFALPSSPPSILLHNPSGVPLEIHVVRVDLAAQKTMRDTVLVQDRPALLW